MAGEDMAEYFESLKKSDRLEQLQIKIRAIVTKNIGESKLVKNCQETYIKLIVKMQEVLRGGKKQYEKDIKILNDKIQLELKKLTDHETRLEYLKIMRQPNQKGTTASRLSLLLQNQSLLKMQFTSEEKMPTEA